MKCVILNNKNMFSRLQIQKQMHLLVQLEVLYLGTTGGKSYLRTLNQRILNQAIETAVGEWEVNQAEALERLRQGEPITIMR